VSTVSVVIPSYNHARFLGACLTSVLTQTRVADQVLVVDDGSGDDTPMVLDDYRDRIEVILKSHEGLRKTVELGLGQATGDYVLFLASDDMLYPHALEVLSSVLDSHPDVAVAYGDITRVDASGALLPNPSSDRPYGKHWDPYRLIKENYIPAPTALCRRDALNEVYAPRFERCGDWEWWINLALAGWYFYGIPRPIAFYRRHDQNLSHDRDRIEALQAEATMLADLAHRHRTRAFRRHLTIQATRRFRAVGWEALAHGRPADARRAFGQALTRPGRHPMDLAGLMFAALPRRNPKTPSNFWITQDSHR
jgi:glycosyltransferase involved in cell wall biosynthesis